MVHGLDPGREFVLIDVRHTTGSGTQLEHVQSLKPAEKVEQFGAEHFRDICQVENLEVGACD